MKGLANHKIFSIPYVGSKIMKALSKNSFVPGSTSAPFSPYRGSGLHGPRFVTQTKRAVPAARGILKTGRIVLLITSIIFLPNDKSIRKENE